MEKFCVVLDGLKPTLLMVMVQFIFAGINICYKLAASNGMDVRILVAYRFLFGAAFMIPLSLIVERKKRPKLTWTVVFQAFLCGLLGGSLGQNMFLYSLVLTSPTFASAMTNLVPAFTFIIAICLRLERLGWQTAAGKAKILGTLIGISGAMVLTFYKGPEIIIWRTNINLLHGSHGSTESSGLHLILGMLIALVSCVCYSLWLIIQAKASEKYPCPYSFTALMTLMASIQSTIVALCTVRDWSQWKLGWNIRLLTIAYAGIIGSGLMFTLVAWVIRLRGPLFVSIFNPLMLILVAIAGSLFLDEKLHLGSILGGIFIIMGLYGVLWGKGKEIKKVSQLMPEKDLENEPYQPTQLELSRSPGGHSRISREGSSRKDLLVTEEIEEETRDSITPTSSPRVIGVYMYP